MSSPKIPYPPSPTDIPEGLTDYPETFTKQQNKLLAGLFVFLIFYLFLVAIFAMVGVWCALTLAKWPVVKIVGMVLSGTFFLYLVKGFFKGRARSKDAHVEVTEEDQPVLFGFIHQLCDEIGAPLPNKVFLSPDVNAACMQRTSLINLFVEPKRDLLIGLGLVNAMNMSEFKAVLAHEFGHFCHLGHTSSYTVVVQNIISDLVRGEDWFDRIINWFKKQENLFSVFGYGVGGCLWFGRKILWWILKTIALQDRAVSREQEFHADLVAVSAAGSDASTHGLLRARFGMQCFNQAINDLVTPARDHKMYTNDLYLHQDRAAAIVRRKKKEPQLGLPPLLATPMSGKSVKVFDAEQDELEDQDDTPPMWRTHPADADREANSKEQFVPAVMDHRSPWLLFTETAELRERMTYKFYRIEFGISKNTELTDAVKVQEYIDNEHADTTYDPKYMGAYDDRPLEPGALNELNTLVHDSPWSDERMQKVYDKLFDGCSEHAEAHSDLHKELASLNANVVGKPSSKMKKKIDEVQKKQDENWEWFKSFDRRVYLLHVQMAAQVDSDMKSELIERYRFQIEVQRFYQEARHNFNKADDYINAYHAAAAGKIEVPNDFGAEVISVLRAAWKVLKNIIKDAREINLPAMNNFEEGARLGDFILEGKMVPEPPLSELKGAWVHKLMTQLQGVKNRCFRLHFKSLGGILSMQEQIATKWLAARAPVATEVLEAEVVETGEVIDAAEVIEGEILPAEIVAEVIDGEVIAEVEVFDAVVEPLPLDALPEEPAPTAPWAMAAFTASPPAAMPPPQADMRPAPPVTAIAVEALPIDEDEILDVAVIEEPPAPVPTVTPATLAATVSLSDDPFSFDAEPEAGPPAAKSEQIEPAKSAAVATAPIDLGNPFSFDVDDVEPEPAPKIDLKFEANPEPKPGSTAAISLDMSAPAEAEIFSLDADDALPIMETPAVPMVAPKPTTPVKPAPAVDAEDIFSLNSEAVVPAPQPLAQIVPVTAKPAAEAPTPSATVKPAFGTDTVPMREAAREGANGSSHAANGKRPAVKITFVKPGEKSPFAK